MTEPTPNHSPELQTCINNALDALDRHRIGWFEAVRQDAVETFPRLSRWRQSQIGCRVPVMDMVVGPLRRNLTMVAESFVTQAAKIITAETGGSIPAMELAGRGIDVRLELEPKNIEFVFKRGWMQGSVSARRQFEQDMMDHIENLYRTHIRSHLANRIDAIIAVMKSSNPTAIEHPDNISLGG